MRYILPAPRNEQLICMLCYLIWLVRGNEIVHIEPQYNGLRGGKKGTYLHHTSKFDVRNKKKKKNYGKNKNLNMNKHLGICSWDLCAHVSFVQFRILMAHIHIHQVESKKRTTTTTTDKPVSFN